MGNRVRLAAAAAQTHRGLFQNSEIPARGAAIGTQGGFGQAKRPLPLLGQALRACPFGDHWSPTAT